MKVSRSATRFGKPKFKFQLLNTLDPAQPVYWRLVSRNNKIVSVSETYSSKRAALRTIKSLQGAGSNYPLEDLTTDG